MTHFNTTGTKTACGKPLLSSSTSSTSAFKSVTCPECRAWVFSELLAPRGFSRPVQWES